MESTATRMGRRGVSLSAAELLSAQASGVRRAPSAASVDARVQNLLLLTGQVVAFWPIWEWYAGRMIQFPENRSGLLALFTALLLLIVFRNKNPRRVGLALPIGCIAANALLQRFVHPLVGCMLAAISIGYTAGQFVQQRRRLALIGLCLLALPVIPSMQTYIGYPLRVIVTELAAPWARMCGFLDATRQGVGIRWSKGLVLVDEPCSGIRMLWTGYYLAFTVAAVMSLSGLRAVAFGALTLVAVVLGNLVRAVTLFVLEARFGEVDPDAHAIIGVFCFAAAGVAIVAAGVWLRRNWNPSPKQVSSQVEPGPRQYTSSQAASLWCSCAISALVPLLPYSQAQAQRAADEANALNAAFPGWPSQFEGKPLREEPMQSREARFYREFTGRIAKFTDGDRQLILRWIPASTRQFHLTQRCFQAIGYSLNPLPAFQDSGGNYWGAFRADRLNESLQVHERIVDSQGRAWTDESAWRWDALWHHTQGPWWAYTLVSKPAASK